MDRRPETRHQRRTAALLSEDAHGLIAVAAGLAMVVLIAERNGAPAGADLVVVVVLGAGALVAAGAWVLLAATGTIERAAARARERDRAERGLVEDPRAPAPLHGVVPRTDGTRILTWRPGRLLLHVGLIATGVVYAVLPAPPDEPGRPGVMLGLAAIVLWRARRYLRPAVVLDGEGLRQPLTGARVAWADVVGVALVDRGSGEGSVTYVEVETRPGSARRRFGRSPRLVRIPPGQLEVDENALVRLLREEGARARPAAGRRGGPAPTLPSVGPTRPA